MKIVFFVMLSGLMRRYRYTIKSEKTIAKEGLLNELL